LDPGLRPYPLVRHLLDAAAMALHLWDAYLAENQRVRIAEGMGLAGQAGRARAVVGLCAGLHDLGKLSGFQFCSVRGSRYLSAGLGGDRAAMSAERFGHDVAGLHSARGVLADLDFVAEGDLRAAERLAEVVGGHHGRFHRAGDGVAPAFLGGAAWARQRTAHAAAVFESLGAPQAPGRFKAPAAVLVTGVVILADWLVSQEDYLRERQRRLEASLADHFRRSQQDAPRLLSGAGLARVRLQRKEFAQAYGVAGEPNPLQRSVMDELCQAVGEGRRGGICLVTAAPGDGKSETALEAERVLSEAFGTQRYAFLLPTMATSDQMHGRVADALLRQSGTEAGLTLVHSMAWLNSAYADEDLTTQPVLTCDGDEAGQGKRRAEADIRPQRWLRGPKRPLLAQFTVGTIDQALMAVLPVRHNALRLLALSGKTFIVDEAHYDPYMQVLLGRLLNWLGAYGVPVILLSATLPASVSDRLIKEYLQGAGHKSRALSSRTFPAPYPGWLYVDGDSGRATPISAARQQEQARARSMDLKVVLEPVVHTCGGGRDRLAVIERILEPLSGAKGGTALVVCNTPWETRRAPTSGSVSASTAVPTRRAEACSCCTPASPATYARPVPGRSPEGWAAADRVRCAGSSWPPRWSSSHLILMRTSSSAISLRCRCCCSGPVGAGGTRTTGHGTATPTAAAARPGRAGHNSSYSTLTSLSGAPPRRRGGLEQDGDVTVGRRSTPASAGRTGAGRRCHRRPSKHPRVGGEDWSRTAMSP
jgi:CRISPR-associated endonuclease/helicase Cas3